MSREPSRKESIIALLVMLAVALYLVWQILAPYLNAIFLAGVLGISGYPLYAYLQRHVRRPALASLIATLAIMVLVGVPVLILVVTVAREAQTMYQTLSANSRSQGGWSAWFSNAVQQPLEWLAHITGLAVPNLQAALMARLQDAGQIVMGRIGGLFGNVTTTLVQAAITFFALYFFFPSLARAQTLAARWVPLPERRIAELSQVIADTVRANVNGTLIVAVAQGSLLGAGFAIVSLPQPWLWGVVGIFASLLPLVGTALIWVPAVAYLLISGAWIRAIVLALWCLVVVGLTDNLLRPWILRGSMPMNTLLVVLSIFGGIEYFGLAGMIAGPVVFSITAALLRILREMMAEKAAPPEGA